MANLAVVQSIEARLREGFDRCPIRLENDAEGVPEGGGPFLLLDFPWTRAEQATIGAPGANRFHEEGAFRLLLSIESRTGTHEARGWLDELAALFRAKHFDGVRTYAPQPAMTNDRNDAGARYQIGITVPYDYSVFG